MTPISIPTPSTGRGFMRPDPKLSNAYLVGGGIASLSAAAYLIRDGLVPAPQIHILESSPITGGSMDGAGSPQTGYILRGGRMLSSSYVCLYDLLSFIPSLSDPKVSVMDEIKAFNAVEGNKTHANSRLVTRQSIYPGERPGHADAADFELSGKDRADLMKVSLQSEKSLGRTEIQEHFRKQFFGTNFWFEWATMFAFQPWHSAVEFRRYLRRFMQELPRIDTLAGVDRTPYNQYDSIILPLTIYLQKQGVDFRYDTKVLDLSYATSEHTKLQTTVEEIHIDEAGYTGVINVQDHDVVFITLGSMTSMSTTGTNSSCPPATAANSPSSDGSWILWKTLSRCRPNFGNPSNFCTRTPESTFVSFTTTLKDPDFMIHLSKWTSNAPGTGALVTFKDSNWLMSIVVPHQPHFISQPADVQVFWGYGLFPTRPGNFVTKPMASCSGSEILTELLGHLRFPTHPTLDLATTIPCNMPYVTSQFLTRSAGDRPQVIPQGCTNLAFMGQFVEIPEDVVFTVEYSVRGAQAAVCGLMGLEKRPLPMYKGYHNPVVVAKVLKTLVEDGVGWTNKSCSEMQAGDGLGYGRAGSGPVVPASLPIVI